jgi:ligand-binding sensor domain-containing protein/signal transduction histidine kinase/DNA-binding response OmpR family regulator
MKNLYIVGFVLNFILSFPVYGEEDFYFQHLGVENGLPQNTVNCIFQDKRGFMWFGTKDGLCRYDGNGFRIFRANSKDKNSIGSNVIQSIIEDEDENIWVGTDRGVYIYHPENENFSRFDLKTTEGKSIQAIVNDIKQDKSGNLWFAVSGQGIFSYKPHQKKLFLYESDLIIAHNISIDRDDNVWIGSGQGLYWYNRKNNQVEKADISGDSEIEQDDIYYILQDIYNDVLLGTANNGIKKMNIVDKQIQSFFPGNEHPSLFIRSIMQRSNDEVWFGTESGIYIYNKQRNRVVNLKHDYTDSYSISDNAIYSLYEDREGGVWIGTYFGGVNYFPPPFVSFKKFSPSNKEHALHAERVREFQQDESGKIWMGTEDNGLYSYDISSGIFRKFSYDTPNDNIAYSNVHGLLADKDKLWVGTFMHGLNIINVKTNQVIAHYQKTNDPHSLSDNSVFSIYKDHTQNVWIGTIAGLNLYAPEKNNFTKIETTGDSFICDILESSDGMMWFASFSNGLFRYNPRNKEWKNFRHNPDDANSLTHNKTISLFEDSRKNLWVATEGGGISKYNPDSQDFISFTTNDGLPNDAVYKILEDENQHLWFTTNNGLCCFNPDDKDIKIYMHSDGLLGNQFNYKSGLKAADGQLYFGCLNGFIAFNPSSFVKNKYIPPVFITDVRLFNKDAKAGENDFPQKRSLITSGEIHLKYNQSSIEIDFAALSYLSPQKNQYAYILENQEKEWSYLTGKHSAVYYNLPPGDYTFRVKGSNNDGVRNELPATLEIHIHPPFYKTKGAYCFYAFALLSLLFFIVVSSKRKINKRNRRKQELFENEKDKELYNAKIAFFTNIAHEIRTPLSLIKSPVEYLLGNRAEMKEEEITENLEVVHKNTNRLLNLTNQLLDFRKIEEKGFRLNFIHTDVKQLINDIYARFKLTAQQKKLDFQLQLPPESIFADIDREAFTKIISNLFTNAIKYADSRILLVLQTENADYFNIKVISDGQLISDEMKEKIFEPFFQIGDENGNKIKSGAGLGLPLARSLAELHQSKLYLETATGEDNVFVLEIPFNQAAAIRISEETTEPDTTPPMPLSGKPTLLIVEDDKEMRDFLSGRLKGSYHILKASNGKIALECLQEKEVDIVVTDIMMPEMDGLQLCSEIKSNVDTSHIPVIMLTAKADIKSRIEGLEVGADAYVEKPFSMEHLSAQISNIFINRNKVKQAFINSPAPNISSIALTKADEIFLEKITKIIQKNLSNGSFNVDMLTDELHISSSTLYRKISGISDLTPNDFIQLVRLNKAAELLQEGSYQISEICFLVGFGSPSYFSKRFKKQFGMSPKEYTRQEIGKN